METTERRMNTRLALALGGGVIISLFFLTYAFIQKEAAEKAQQEAVAAYVLADKNAELLRKTEENCNRIMQQKDSIIRTLNNGRR